MQRKQLHTRLHLEHLIVADQEGLKPLMRREILSHLKYHISFIFGLLLADVLQQQGASG